MFSTGAEEKKKKRNGGGAVWSGLEKSERKSTALFRGRDGLRGKEGLLTYYNNNNNNNNNKYYINNILKKRTEQK